MMRSLPLLAALALLGAGQSAVAAPAPVPSPPAALAPAEIVAAAPQGDWLTIAPDDLLVMDLTPDAAGKARRVVIQLLPPPFSQGWIGNIRKLAAAHWWDGLSINRVQDNYVVQWGDAEGEDPAKARPLPPGLKIVSQPYTVTDVSEQFARTLGASTLRPMLRTLDRSIDCAENPQDKCEPAELRPYPKGDAYSLFAGHAEGWQYAESIVEHGLGEIWPIHCYGAVGVGRNMPPDTGTGAELYTVIGTPPRHLDRNIAVIGRVIEGIEHLSSLPRGTGPLGFYVTPGERTGISSIRLGSALSDLPRYQYLSTESASFANYVEARANRRDAFFIRPAGGADICNLPVPVRRAP